MGSAARTRRQHGLSCENKETAWAQLREQGDSMGLAARTRRQCGLSCENKETPWSQSETLFASLVWLAYNAC